MKKILSAVAALSILSAGAAFAIPFSDNFYGTFDDGDYVDLYRYDSVTLNFDILDDFNPTTQDVLSASLTLDFWSEDPQDETVQIKAGVYDGNTLLAEQWYDLGGWNWWIFSGNEAAKTTLNIDLASFLPYTQDGLFTSIVFMPAEGWCDCDNDIRLEGATFSGEASAPVPEPSTMLLFGAGALGLLGYSRKRSNKKA
jgi:hypothetical protein